MSKTKQREKARMEARIRGLEEQLSAMRGQRTDVLQPPPDNKDLAKDVADELMPLRRLQASVRADDGTEENVRRILLMTIEELARGQSHEGVIFGPLAVAASWAAEKLCERWELDPQYEYAVKHWLVGKWGEQIHTFDPEEFLAWEMGRRERVRASAASAENQV